MISSVSSAASTLSIDSILQAGSKKSTSGVSTTSQAGDSADISGPAKLFAALKELATENPEKFKEVTADIASKLKAAAGTDSTSSTTSTTGGSDSRLADLAAKFEQASQTGDVSVLQPPSHHHGAGGYDRAGKPQGPPPPPPSTDSSNGVDLKALFASINDEVNQALSA